MKQVETPKREGWHAFHGYYEWRNGHIRELRTLLQVQKIGYNKELLVQVSINNWRELSAFRGKWWEVELPWEREQEHSHV